MARRTTDDDTKEPRRVGRADELYGLPLDQFTAARDRLAKSLREAGDRDAAGQVKALRKPNTTVWAVNQLVRRSPRKMEAFFKAADRLRAAQRGAFGPGGGEGLRAASEQLRSQIAELVAAAREVLAEAGARADIKALEAVRAILQATPTAPDRERRRLERGTLTEPLRPAQFSEVLAMMGGGRGGLRLVPPPEVKEVKEEKTREKDRKAARRAAEEERARRLSAERERALARRAAKEEQAQQLYERRERARQAEARRARDEARREAVREAKAAERAAATGRRAALAAERAEEAALRAREQADAAEEAAETARARAAEAEQRLAEAEAELVEERPRRASRR